MGFNAQTQTEGVLVYCRFAFVFEIWRQQKNPEAFSFEIQRLWRTALFMVMIYRLHASF